MKWQMVKIKIPKRREIEELFRRIDANMRAADVLLAKRGQVFNAATALIEKQAELVLNRLHSAEAERQVAEARAGLHALVAAAADLPAKEAELAAARADLRMRESKRKRKRNSTSSSSRLIMKRVTATEVRARVRIHAEVGAALKKTEELVAQVGADLGALLDVAAYAVAQPGLVADLIRRRLDL